MVTSRATPVTITSPPNLFQLSTPPSPVRSEQFHQNTVTLSGIVQAVRESVESDAPTLEPDIVLTLSVYDRFAPAERRDPTPTTKRPAHSITLRLPHGRTLDGHAVSVSPRQRVRVTGYLRDHSERLSLNRVWAQLKQLDRAQPGDDAHQLTGNATHVIVESLASLSEPLSPEAFDENSLVLSGITQRIWTSTSTRSRSPEQAPDMCVRFAMYDRHAEIIPPDQLGTQRRDPLGQLPTRRAHYTTLRFPGGRPLDGGVINLSPNTVLRVTGYLRSIPYRQSLHEILTRLRQIERLQEDDAQRYVQRLTHHVVVTSCICFGAVPFEQLE